MTRPVNDWDARPQGTTFPHTHQIDPAVAQAAADPGVDQLEVNTEKGVLVPELGWQRWTIAECAGYARRLHGLHMPRLTWRHGWYLAACTCGRRAFGDCPHARWVRSWLAFDQALTRTLSLHVTPPQSGRTGLEFGYREPHGPHEVRLVATCDGGVHIGQDWYPMFDRDAFRRDALHTLATHHPLGLRRNRLAWHWPPLLPRLRICFGCALTCGPTWTIGLCTHRRQARAWMYAPGWWRRCAGTPCHQWPRTTPAHKCSHGYAVTG